MAKIISASRRTDIPRYFARFFNERRRAGCVGFRNAFGGKGSASLREEDVLGYLFWTRFARPFADNLGTLRDQGVPHVFQYTITGYGRDLEPHTPSAARAVEDFLAVSSRLPDPACIQWRYDPLIVSDTYDVGWHLENFASLAGELAQATRVVNTSLIEPYQKTIRRVADATVHYRKIDPSRHKSVAKRYPALPQASESTHQLLRDLGNIASEHGMELRACSNPELGLPTSQCCSAEMFAPYGAQVERELADLRPRPSREGCRCLEAVDIGMDNTCLAGCKYCYVLVSHESAVNNFRRHDPRGVSVR
jgi:hypothetical protein